MIKDSNIIADLTENFAVRIMNLYQYLLKVGLKEKLADQILRSGTSIGANVAESIHAPSRKDFANKLNIALKEADETKYWLSIFHRAKYLNADEYESINNDCLRIIGTLVKILKTTKNKVVN